MNDDERKYPCDTCGGVGWVGQNLTVPCRVCGTTGELVDEPKRSSR